MHKPSSLPQSQHVGPSTPAPSPTSPTSDSFRSRSSSPSSPLSYTEQASYGSARISRIVLGQTSDRRIRTEGEIQAPRECRDNTNPTNEQSWLLSLLNSHYSPYLLLENSGSVARDHLASERTFLAYVRTSLAIASAGVALVQLFSVSSSSNTSKQIQKNLLRFARPLGATVIVIGILVLIIGFWRYFRIQAALIAGKFPPARLAIAFISSIIAVLIAVVFGVLVQTTR